MFTQLCTIVKTNLNLLLIHFIHFTYVCFATTNKYKKENYVKDMVDHSKEEKSTTNKKCK